MSHLLKFILCVVAIVVPVMVAGFSWPDLISEETALLMFGVPFYIYFSLARLFSAGEPFNIFLLGTVFSIYVAMLLMPLYFMFRKYRWLLLVTQGLIIILHLLLSGLLFMI